MLFIPTASLRLAGIAALLLVGVSGCSLYQPLLPTLPAVRKAGDVAVAGTWQVPYAG